MKVAFSLVNVSWELHLQHVTNRIWYCIKQFRPATKKEQESILFFSWQTQGESKNIILYLVHNYKRRETRVNYLKL